MNTKRVVWVADKLKPEFVHENLNAIRRSIDLANKWVSMRYEPDEEYVPFDGVMLHVDNGYADRVYNLMVMLSTLSNQLNELVDSGRVELFPAYTNITEAYFFACEEWRRVRVVQSNN